MRKRHWKVKMKSKRGCWDKMQREKMRESSLTGERFEARVAGVGRGQEASNSMIFSLRVTAAL